MYPMVLTLQVICPGMKVNIKAVKMTRRITTSNIMLMSFSKFLRLAITNTFLAKLRAIKY